MVWFEVFIPAKEAGMPNVTLTVEAQNWIGALRTGLSNLGEGHEAIANVMCDIKEDNSIHVTDVATQRVFRLREVKPPQAPPASTSLAPENTGKQAAAPPVAPDEDPLPPPPVARARPVSLPNIEPLRAPDVSAPRPGPLAPPVHEHTVPWTRSPPVAVPEPVDEDAATMEVPAGFVPAMPLPVVPAPAVPAPAAWPPIPPPFVPPPPLPAPSAAAAPLPVPHLTPMALPAAPAHLQKKAQQAVEATERVSRAPKSGPALAEKKKTGPLTLAERGALAPPPLRTSGQFDAAPAPALRQESPSLAPHPAFGDAARPAVQAQAVADAVADVFDATQDLLLEVRIAPDAIAARLLDIALQHVPAESGSFYLADVNGHELRFAAVRGPKAREIQQKKLSVKVGQGIVGFCAQEGVCVSVSNIQKDPRYFSAVAVAVGHSPRDTLCASAEKDGRLFGAVQLINSEGGFSPVHMEVLRYIGLTAAALLERHFDNSER